MDDYNGTALFLLQSFGYTHLRLYMLESMDSNSKMWRDLTIRN